MNEATISSTSPIYPNYKVNMSLFFLNTDLW